MSDLEIIKHEVECFQVNCTIKESKDLLLISYFSDKDFLKLDLILNFIGIVANITCFCKIDKLLIIKKR